MRLLLALLATGLLSGCSCAQLDQAELLAGDAPAVAVVDTREPAGLYAMPGVDGDCASPIGSIDIPCRDVINVCVAAPEGTEALWFPEHYRCVPDSPTWRDVCRLAPEWQWQFYGYTDEECAAA